MRYGVTPRRLATAATLVAIALAWSQVHRFWRRELSHLTGNARWLWVTDELERPFPTGGLFVASLRLDVPPRGALLKVCGDRDYVVYVNGSAAACGWSRPGFRLDMFDIGHLLRQGSNVVAVEVRSPTPVGGVLLALDVEGVGSNVLVSGNAFVSRTRFGLDAPGSGDLTPPVEWGRPPRYPWGYPPAVSHPRTLDEVVVEEPLRIERRAARALAGGGLEFAIPKETFGYLWLEFEEDGPSWVVTKAHGEENSVPWMRGEAQVVVRQPGQKRWLDPLPRATEKVFVFGRRLPAAVEIWPVAEDFRPVAPGVVTGTHGPVQRTRWRTRTPPG